jgi:hypothetical protein
MMGWAPVAISDGGKLDCETRACQISARQAARGVHGRDVAFAERNFVGAMNLG